MMRIAVAQSGFDTDLGVCLRHGVSTPPFPVSKLEPGSMSDAFTCSLPSPQRKLHP